MKLETELKLSYYKELTDVDGTDHVKLVQHTDSGKIFVLKTMRIYNIGVFSYLQANPSKGTPRIIELIEDDNTLYVVEEYISGSTLREKLQSEGPLSAKEAIGYINQLCDILGPLHSLKPPIVHRDIKPSNLIVTSEGKIVLVDFNAAKEIEPDKSQDTVLIGTAGYAAPEQYGFSLSKPTADIYAIGVLLNEMLTGYLLTQGYHSGRLKEIIRKCTQMDPAKRFQTVYQLKQALRSKEQPQKKEVKGLCSWLPPGFRGRNPWVVVSAFLWYCFFIALSLSLEVENGTRAESTLYHVFFYRSFLLKLYLSGIIKTSGSHSLSPTAKMFLSNFWG